MVLRISQFRTTVLGAGLWYPESKGGENDTVIMESAGETHGVATPWSSSRERSRSSSVTSSSGFRFRYS